MLSVSFIVAYYNLPLQLLSRCLQSIIEVGTMSGEWLDWEVRVIDDGSDYGQEAESLVKSFANPRLCYHRQQNGGLSAARNFGLKHITKKYVAFVDADDYLFPSTSIAALHTLHSKQPEMLKFSFSKVWGELPVPSPISPTLNGTNIISYQGDGIDFLLTHNLQASAWSYFVETRLLDTLRFTPSLLHEDEEFTPLLLLRVKHLLVLRLPVYAYYQRHDSIMHPADLERLAQSFADRLTVINRLDHRAKCLPTPSAEALKRRVEMLKLDYIFNIVTRAPSLSFLRDLISTAQAVQLWPVHPVRFSLKQQVFKILVMSPRCLPFLWRIYMLKQKAFKSLHLHMCHIAEKK